MAAVRYDDGTGGLVEALTVRTEDAVARRQPGVILAHGGFEGGKHLFLAQGTELARQGFTVLVADTSFPRAGDAGAVESAVRVAVLTHRRGLDVLEEVYQASRLGFFGHSRGGSEGAVLSAVDGRLDAVVIGGMGSASRVRRSHARRVPRLAPYFDAIFSFDAGIYLGVPGRRSLLVQHGRNDPEVSLCEAKAMFEAAAEPKTWREYDCGHSVDSHPRARNDRILFFKRELAARA